MKALYSLIFAFFYPSLANAETSSIVKIPIESLQGNCPTHLSMGILGSDYYSGIRYTIATSPVLSENDPFLWHPSEEPTDIWFEGVTKPEFQDCLGRSALTRLDPKGGGKGHIDIQFLHGQLNLFVYSGSPGRFLYQKISTYRHQAIFFLKYPRP
jgi:hypothetical protein